MPQYAAVYLSVAAQFRVAMPEIYFCSAADADDAAALCEHANPGSRVLGVTEGHGRLEHDQSLQEFFRGSVAVGSPVCWVGPSGDPRTGICSYQGVQASAGGAVSLESCAGERFDAAVSEIALLPMCPEERIKRLQSLVGDCLGMAHQAVTAAGDAEVSADDDGAPVNRLLYSLSEAEQCLAEIGVADLESRLTPPASPVDQAA